MTNEYIANSENDKNNNTDKMFGDLHNLLERNFDKNIIEDSISRSMKIWPEDYVVMTISFELY